MSDALDHALRLLTRREHGASELGTKLKYKGYEESDIEQVLQDCQRLEYQSDERFAELITQVRIRQGYGHVRIKQELQAKKISFPLITQALKAVSVDWKTQAEEVWKKKFWGKESSSPKEQQKQNRFLIYRGFPPELVREVIKEMNRISHDHESS